MPVLIVGNRCLHIADVRRGAAAHSEPEDLTQEEWCLSRIVYVCLVAVDYSSFSCSSVRASKFWKTR